MNSRSLLLCSLFLAQFTVFAAKQPAEPDPKTLRMFGIKIRQATQAFEADDFAKTRSSLEEAEKLVPDSPVAINLRGAMLFKAKKYEEALVEFQHLIERDANSYPGYFNKAEVYLAQKKYEEALSGFDLILKARPGDEVVQFRIALVLALQGKTEEATAKADKIPNPGQSAAYYYAHAAIEFVNKNPAKGQQWIQQSEAYFPADESISLRKVLVENQLLKE